MDDWARRSSELLRDAVAESRPGRLFVFNHPLEDAREIVAQWRTDARVTLVRGLRMRTWHDLYLEYAAAFQFPLYFGGNLIAFQESLSEPEVDQRGQARICVVAQSEFVLDEEPPGELRKLIGATEMVARNWRDDPQQGELVTVLMPRTAEQVYYKRWLDAGASIVTLGHE